MTDSVPNTEKNDLDKYTTVHDGATETGDKLPISLTAKSEELISITSTICLNCIFADYDQQTQVGCHANRLELFKQAGHEIQDTMIGEKTCHVIEGKTCVYYRNQEWSKQYYHTEDTNQILIKVKQELKIPYHTILFFRKNDTPEDLKKRLTELANQDIKPKIVTVIDRSHNVKIVTTQLTTLIQNYNFQHWRVQTIQAIDQLDSDVVDLVFDSTKKIPFMFYILLECSSTIPLVMSKELHTALHDNMKSFVVALPNKNNIGKMVLKIAHQKYAGNSFTIPLEDKIKHYDDASHLITKVEEICPSLHQS